MNEIDLFGCSFTESPDWNKLPVPGEFDLLLYSMHCQSTKPVSNFIQFDLAYNGITNYNVNNFAGGSFGNHVIKEIIKNRIKVLDKTKSNIAIVQLSALLRNEHSFEVIFNSEYSSLNKSYFSPYKAINPSDVKNDYLVEYDNMDDFYKVHIQNLKEIISLLKENYNSYYIHFGWDISTKEFQKLFIENELEKEIGSWEYDFSLYNLQYFENQSNYIKPLKKAKGKYGGMLEYSANQLDEKLRYVHIIQDHHPSYFSNKIFYKDIIRRFLQNFINFDKSYFEENSLIKFEDFLADLLPTKESTDGRIYGEMQVKIVNYIRNSILNTSI